RHPIASQCAYITPRPSHASTRLVLLPRFKTITSSELAVPRDGVRCRRGPLASEPVMDDDLDALSRVQLILEVKRLRAGIREHRDSTGHELCWHHPKLWGLLPERTDPLPEVPAWPQFLDRKS